MRATILPLHQVPLKNSENSLNRSERIDLTVFRGYFVFINILNLNLGRAHS